MNPLRQLQNYGQSIWLDYIRRNLITSGGLKRLIDEDGLRGVTSNPTIFEKAIAGSKDYDQALSRLLAAAEMDVRGLFEALAIDDLRAAADLLRPVYDETGGQDGFVSLEVSPHLAHDTSATIAEARRLWSAVNKPNVMIKVPATAEGIPAIETLIGEGININITLMFSMAHYEAVARAYIRGLERAAQANKIASVASFFVSRVDTMVDKALERVRTPEALALRGKIAIANAKLVYQRFKAIFYGNEFAALRERGARVQRPLWASTGAKNPAYSDVLYVEELVGPHTVNTMPPATLDAFRDHGQVRGNTVEENVADAADALNKLQRFDIDLLEVGAKLQTDGIASFVASLDQLMTALEKKRAAMAATPADRQSLNLGQHQARLEQRLQAWRTGDFSCRFWRKDHALWVEKPEPELTDRMGWLTLPESMPEHVEDLSQFAREVSEQGLKHVLLFGMGGSSLAPEVFQRTFGNASGYPELIVLDSTHPAAVRAVETQIDLLKTLFLVSSKSGTTTETLSFFHYFWDRLQQRTKAPGRHFVAITDPATPLESLAQERHFRRIFPGSPEVGGRYAALSVFGLVPAALIGVDIKKLLNRAWIMAESCAFCVPAHDIPCLGLGAALGELATAGRNKVTVFASPALASFPAWLEQLIAESTGKHGKGIVPIADEPPAPSGIYGDDRIFIHLKLANDDQSETDRAVADLEKAGHPVIRIQLRDKSDLGQEFFRWEIAVAAAGAVLGINPFNQPDVELAKKLAKEAMHQGGAQQQGKKGAKPAAVEPELADVNDPEELERNLKLWLADSRQGDYVALQAYLAPDSETSAALQRIRLFLRNQLRLSTTLGYGPRFLHSTGQLHKGGPNSGIFLQLLDQPADDLQVPETSYTFGALIQAQAVGDYHALKRGGRRVLRVQLGKSAAAGLKQLFEVLQWLKSPRFSGTWAA